MGLIGYPFCKRGNAPHPRRGQKGRTTCGFPSSLNSYLSLVRWSGADCRHVTAAKWGNGRGFFSTVGEHSVLPCPDIFAVPDTVLLHRRFRLRWVRHNSAARFVSLEVTDSTYEDKWHKPDSFAGAVRYNVPKGCATLLCRACAELPLCVAVRKQLERLR